MAGRPLSTRLSLFLKWKKEKLEERTETKSQLVSTETGFL